MATRRASRAKQAEAQATKRGRPTTHRPSGSEQAEPRPRQPVSSVFGGSSEVGGLVRAILLGAVVGSVTVFLLYPDIARLMARLPFSPPSLSPSSSVQSSSSPSANPVASPREHWVETSSETASDRQSGSAGRLPLTNGEQAKAKDDSLAREKRKSENKITVSNAERTPRTLGQTAEVDIDKQTLSSDLFASDDCLGADVDQGSSCRQATSEKKIVHGDLMEGEEEDDDEEVEFIVEEDPADMQLMEVGEGLEYTELKEDGEKDPPRSMSEKPEFDLDAESPSKWRKSVENTRKEFHISNLDLDEHSNGWDQEPITVKDGQTITFTPVSPGDENTIRIGGRKRPNIQQVPSLNEPLDSLELDKQTQTKTAYKTETVSGEQAKTKSGAEKTKAESSSEGGKSKNASQKTKDQRSTSSKSKNKASGSDNDPKRSPRAADSSQDLPEEVRNFQPTYLKTVTAKKIFADGRRIPPVELLPQKDTNSSVRVYLFNDFLSVEECDGLQRVHDKHVKDVSAPPLLCFSSLATLRKHLQDVNSTVHVTPNDFIEGTRCVNVSFSRRLERWLSGNWSYSTAFYPGESRFSDVFAGRVQQAMGLDPHHGGKFQITSYPTGKAYKAHTDCVLDNQDQRDRVATVLVYLGDVEDGGETTFPELGIWVKPRKGRALVWNNMSPEGACEAHSLHVASKVNKGSKYILIRWYYYKSFYSLGKRPPEPPIPARAPGTPRVSCDDYDNGSCRWYDEWNMDHLLDYEAKKYTLV